ncbi:MAG: Dam family site-specific DNA-(adenine-N6)-methyltransferase [Opitutales bacterium]|nr:Dam family site-specific DNA-(adenine-N6)-methyltransferase [Opitutales bacterium]
MVIPIVKWAGGKRQLLPLLVQRMPKFTGTYYEPFFGGGALFFHIAPQKAVINDCNPQLINVYQQIKLAPDELIRYLSTLQNDYNALPDDTAKTNFYFSQRTTFNTFIQNNTFNVYSASLFIFLNKAGFNGLYRVSSKGCFNVPSGHKKTLNLFQPDNIFKMSELLKRCVITQGDFEISCQNANAGDFVFFDSPYYATFDAYQSNRFPEADQKRLAQLFRELSNKGVYCMLTNSSTDFIKDLYKGFSINEVPVKRMINCDSSKRTSTEVIITNF